MTVPPKDGSAPRAPLSYGERPQLSVGRFCAKVLFTMFFARASVVGRENIPKGDSPYILALNHRSVLDPALVWAFYPDPVYFLTRQQLHDLPIFGWMCHRVGNIPVRPGPFDLRAIRTAVSYLTRLERNVAVFVKGLATGEGGPGEVNHGCALLASRTGARVVPAHVHGTDEALPPRSIVPRFTNELSLHVGKSLDLNLSSRPRRQELEQATARVLAAIAGLDPRLLAGLHGHADAQSPRGDG
ncbi:MAG: 1-acyl-sn-glycerol-3-phosphate acyltransferase [Candidatus Riflebacteria bacterium]|nr:1-acyl-sn-glycerol-3-phosphate acyltransferase [Candidatus Riflebacteria bacterium]